MKCDDVIEKLSAYADGEIQGREGKRIEEHLGKCDACSKRLSALGILQSRVRDGLREAVEPVDMTESVMSLLPAARRAGGRRVWVWAAACVLVLIAGGLYFGLPRPDKAPRSTAYHTPVQDIGVAPPEMSQPGKPVQPEKAASSPAKTAPRERPARAKPHRVAPGKPIVHQAEPPDPEEAPGAPEEDVASADVLEIEPAASTSADQAAGWESIERSPEGTFLCANAYSPGGELVRVRLMKISCERPNRQEMEYVASTSLATPDGIPTNEIRRPW